MRKRYRKQYTEYLKSEKWAKIRQQKALEQNYTCEKCGKVVKKGFHIHHKTYERFTNEPLTDLMFLCKDCHNSLHIDLKAKANNRKKKPKDRKTCNNCYYSQVMIYKGKTNRKVLYCNINLRECDNSICNKYKKPSLQS